MKAFNCTSTTVADLEPTSFTDNLSNRKYLVADYNPSKQSQSDFLNTTTSVVNAQSDFNLGGKTNSSTRLLARNSIVPLMSQQATQAQRRQTILMDVPAALPSNSTTRNSNTSTSCTTPPPIIFLFVTLLMTISATGMLCFAVMTDHWEIVKWDRNLLEHLANKTTPRTVLHWHLDDRVARMSITRK